MNASPSSCRQMPGSSSTTSTGVPERTDLWSDILRSAEKGRSRGKAALRRKNILLLSEKHHGRRYLLDQLLSSPSASSSSRNRKTKMKSGGGKAALAMGYEVLEIREEGEDSVSPVSIFYPPSSSEAMMRLIPVALPSGSLADTGVVIVLDWTRPSSMVNELIHWLKWIEKWSEDSGQSGDAEEMRERLQSHLQHYAEPTPPSAGSSLPSITTTYGAGPLLPLGPGTVTMNKSGIPITVVCTKADLMDTVGDELGMKGAWEERTDWIQQVLRTLCLAYGAALFYTAPTAPSTFTLLRSYLLHRLYTTPPPLNPSTDTPAPLPQASSNRFPFNHRANVLDRDAVMVPAGWDSWGKINVMRDRFDPGRVERAWEASLGRLEDGEEMEKVEDLWVGMIPDTERPRAGRIAPAIQTVEPEQAFLSRQLETLLKDPNRDPRASFRTTIASSSASIREDQQDSRSSGVVGPMGGSGLNLPGVEKALVEMEGGTAEDLMERFARLGRRESSRNTTAGPLSPTGSASGGTTPGVPNEALHNFFQGLLATKAKSTSTTPAKPPPADDSRAMPPPPVPAPRISPKPPNV